MIEKHTLDTLEFPKLISLIAGKCLTPYGRCEVEAIEPLIKIEQIREHLDCVSQMKDIISFGDPFPLVRLDDCRKLLDKSSTEGIFLDPKEILAVAELIAASIELNRYGKEERDNFPAIAEHLKALRAFPELKQEISRAIDDEGEIKDSASPTLRKVRLELTDSRHKITVRLQKIISGQVKQAGWTDDVVTIRNNRYVIPVPSTNYRSDFGILHDRSQSGATFYVEPSDTVELNNRIHLLFQEERQEIDRILRSLTQEIASRLKPLMQNTQIIGLLDSFHACAGFSILIKGNAPLIRDEALFDLIDVRHPLLSVQLGWDKVIPNTLDLNDTRQAILITGPNTGGKTITLKTIGLTVLMAQSGLHIAADEKSEVGIFTGIFADIGDEQSIELSLSTFSSHIHNIIHGLKSASDSTLLLFDEIGVGTDPQEGSALAEAIILYAVERSVLLVATTHYSQLKTLATEYPQIENCSLEFDRETLSPTYRLQLGVPGSSYAVEIAGRLGMPREICDRAGGLIGSGEKSLGNLIGTLEKQLASIRRDRIKLTERLEKATKHETYFREQSEKLKKDVDAARKEALEETVGFVDETRREIERLVADIRENQASRESLQEFHKAIKLRSAQARDRLNGIKSPATSPDSYEIGDYVEILSLNQRGEIERLVGDSKAQVKVGNIRTTVDIRNLRKVARLSSSKAATGSTSFLTESVLSNEIHLRGMTVDEAIEALERFLDRATIAGLEHIYVIHGKGTGTLRKKLTGYLKGRKEVKSMRLGDWNEGGAGVTVVNLKS